MSENDARQQKEIIRLEKGDLIGWCSECDVGVLEADIINNFPCCATHRQCGSELDEVRVLDKSAEVQV